MGLGCSFYLKFIWEVEQNDVLRENWKLHTKGGTRRKWSGNIDRVVKWDSNTIEFYRNDKTSRILDKKYWDRTGIVWNGSSNAKNFGARFLKSVDSFNKAAPAIFLVESNDDEKYYLGVLNSSITKKYLELISSSNYNAIEDILRIPVVIENRVLIEETVEQNLDISKSDWNSIEYSWDFQQNELVRFNKEGGIETLEEAYDHYKQYWQNKFYQLHQNEEKLNRQFIEIYGLEEELSPDVPLNEITILQEELDGKKLKKLNMEFRGRKIEDGSPKTVDRVLLPQLPFKDKEVMAQFLSYAVGCMFGRYSLNQESLILANQGETLEDYLERVGKSADETTFLPDEDNIIPVLEDNWFEDDITGLFYQFLRTSFGEQNFEKNLAFIEDKLGHDIRTYFSKYFYKDHYKRYNQRPIYWQFSSESGVFKALIYMHRYTPDTLNHMLNGYLRDFKSKLNYQKSHLQDVINSSQDAKEVNKAEKEQRKVDSMIEELESYERDVLMPLATDRIEIDLDDGVLVNYNKFGRAVEEVKSLNDPKKKKKVKEFDWIDSEEIR